MITFAYNCCRVLGVTKSGTQHLVYTNDNAAVYLRDGKSQSHPASGYVQSIALAVDSLHPQELWFIWATGRDVRVARSTDEGLTWSAATVLQSAQGVQPNLYVYDHDAHATWHVGPEASSVVYGATWNDGGTPRVEVISKSSGGARFPSIAGDEDYAVVVWRDSRQGGWRLYGADYSDGTWEEFRLDREGHDPSLAYTTKGPILGFQNTRKVYRADGLVGAATAQIDGSGLFPRVVSDGKSRCAIVWEDMDAGASSTDNTSKRVGVIASTDSGKTWKVPALTGDIAGKGLAYATGAFANDGTLLLAAVNTVKNTVITGSVKL